MKILEQKRYFTKWTYLIRGNGLEINIQKIFGSRKYLIPYENISSEFLEINYYSKIRFWLTILLGLFFTFALYEQIRKNFINSDVLIFYGAIALAGTVALFLSYKKLILIQTIEQPIALLKDKPSEKDLNKFLEHLFYVRERYITQQFDIDPRNSSNVEDLYKLFIMHKEGALTDKEFEELKKEILAKGKENIGIVSKN